MVGLRNMWEAVRGIVKLDIVAKVKHDLENMIIIYLISLAFCLNLMVNDILVHWTYQEPTCS